MPAAPGSAASKEASNSMSDNNEAKIQRRERYIEEARREAKLLSPEGQQTMQTVIDSYERADRHGARPRTREIRPPECPQTATAARR
jgi:hypothetical protein